MICPIDHLSSPRDLGSYDGVYFPYIQHLISNYFIIVRSIQSKTRGKKVSLRLNHPKKRFQSRLVLEYYDR